MQMQRMIPVRRGAALVVEVALVGATLVGQTPVAMTEKPAPQPVLLELFTSEGCSSCPPADDLLGKMQGTETAAGQRIIVLSEHVTYWNQLGWVDPFSKEIFTERQNAYGERFNLDSVYTPQVVVNGNWQTVGTDAASVRRAMLSEGSPEAVAKQAMLKIVSVVPVSLPKSSNYLSVVMRLERPLPEGAAVYAVVADDMDVSDVLRGENIGRKLTHVSVARMMMRLPQPNASGTTSVMVPLPGTAVQSQHLVLFAQAAGQGSVLSVASVAVPTSATGRFPQSSAAQ